MSKTFGKFFFFLLLFLSSPPPLLLPPGSETSTRQGKSALSSPPWNTFSLQLTQGPAQKMSPDEPTLPSGWPLIIKPLTFMVVSLVAQTVKNLLAMQETWVRSLGGEDPLKKEMATPLQYSCLENSMDRGSLVGYSP